MAVRVQTHTAAVTVTYKDTLTVGQYVYSTRTAAVTVTYTDTLTEGEEERVAVRVQYTYCHSYCDLHGYSDRGGRGESGSTCTVHILPQLP